MLTITPNATTKDRIPLDFHILEKKVDLCFTSLHIVYNLSSPSCSQTLAGCFGVGVLPRGPHQLFVVLTWSAKHPALWQPHFRGPPGTPVMWGLMGRRTGLLLPPPPTGSHPCKGLPGPRPRSQALPGAATRHPESRLQATFLGYLEPSCPGRGK